MDRKQHTTAFEGRVVLVQDKRHTHRAGLVFVGDQKVATNVQFAVVFFVEAGRFFDVLVHRVFWDLQAVILLDPALFFGGRRFEVHPNWLEF